MAATLRNDCRVNSMGSKVVNAANRKIEDTLRRIADLHCGLSPENLACDGLASPRQIHARRNEIEHELTPLLAQFKSAYGFEPDEIESYELSEAFAKSAREGMNAIGKARKERKLTNVIS